MSSAHMNEQAGTDQVTSVPRDLTPLPDLLSAMDADPEQTLRALR